MCFGMKQKVKSEYRVAGIEYRVISNEFFVNGQSFLSQQQIANSQLVSDD